MNATATTLILGTQLGVCSTITGEIVHNFEIEIVELIELPATKSVESYDDGIVVLQFTLARVAAARVWNATRALMSFLGDAYVAHGRSLGVDRDTPFSDLANKAVWSYPASFRSLNLRIDNRDKSMYPPRDLNALAQRDAWCDELRAAIPRFVAEDTRCCKADTCFGEFLEEKMHIEGAASRNWLYPAKCTFDSSAVYEPWIY